MIPPIYVGIDVSKSQLDLASNQSTKRYANHAAGISALIKNLPAQAHLLVEATGGYERALVHAAHRAAVPVSVLNPARVRHFARACGRWAKTDPIDACLLRDFGQALRPAADLPPDPTRLQLAELVNTRTQLIALRTQLSNGLEHLQLSLLRQCFRSQIRALDTRLAKIDAAIAATIKSSPELEQRATALKAHPGVGPQTSATLLAHLPELGHANRNQIASLAGLAPFNRDSGQTQGPRSIHGGRPAVRRALYLAALSAVRANSPIGSFYQNLRNNGKPPKLALIASARKLLCLLNSSLKSLPSPSPF